MTTTTETTFYNTYGTQRVRQAIEHALSQGSTEAQLRAYPVDPMPKGFADWAWGYTSSCATIEKTVEEIERIATEVVGECEVTHEHMTDEGGEEFVQIFIHWSE